MKYRRLKQPSYLVLFYLIGLSFTFLFVDSFGQSTFIDEILLFFMLPIGLIGLFKYFFKIDYSSKLILLYFFFVALSSLITLASRSDVPLIAPVLGILLDMKFLIFLGALLYFAECSEKSGEEIVLDICNVIVFIGVINSIFFLRDILSSGTSVSGIMLRSSNIFGYMPIGLFSHKLYAAVISSLSFASAVTLYLHKKKIIFLLCSVFFLIILIFSSSMKELGVLLGLFLILLRVLNDKKSNRAESSRNLLLVSVFLVPILGYMFGSALDKLVTSRINLYLIEENVRSALHVTSGDIATDYFPLGSGAGTFSSKPSRDVYYSPLYYEYGMYHFYGASEFNPSYLMDAGWPKFIAEAGWIGGGAYFFAYFLSFLSLLLSLLKQPDPINIFGTFIGSLIFSSALGSSVFTGDIGLMLCAILLLCLYLSRRDKLSYSV